MDPTFLILIAVFGLMLWFMSRGAKKQRRKAEDMRSNLAEGEQVMTASGLYGTIVDIDGDVITLETSPGVELMWKREAISAVTEPPFAVEEDDEDTEEEASDESEEIGIVIPDDASSLSEGVEEKGPEEQDPSADSSDEAGGSSRRS